MQSTNKYIDTLMQVNNIGTVQELSRLSGSYVGRLIKYYKPADEVSYKYILIVKLLRAGLVIPYHHRPKCVNCGSVYNPSKIRQWRCGECMDEDSFSLSISDYKELDFAPEKIAKLVGLPQTSEVIRLIEEWEEEEESTYLAKLKKIVH